MLRDDAVARIQDRLGFTTALADKAQRALFDTQEELEHDDALPWFLIEEMSEIQTQIGEERIVVPSNFLREYDPSALYLYIPELAGEENEWKELKKQDISFLRKRYPGEGPPQGYALVNQYFRLRPTPDDTYTIKQIYYKQDAKLTSNIENLWLKHASELMIGRAGAKLTGTRDRDAISEFQRMEARGRRRMIVDNIARAANGSRYIMGGED